MNSKANENTDFQVDLTNCDREAIHIPGFVQEHGVLMVLNDDFQIIQISANCLQHFGRSAEELLNAPLSVLLDSVQIANLQRQILAHEIQTQPIYLNSLTIANRLFEVLAHRSEKLLILEFEHPPQDDVLKVNQNPYSNLSFRLREINNAQSVVELCRRAAETVRALTSFDRVMIYRFLEDESGEVIAESVREELEPFLGLHYPASDIPKQARALYLKQTLRFKVDVNDLSSPLVPTVNPKTGQPLDLSFAATRAMSPIHVEYLKNMGVASSMSISIVKDGILWGLIACHHQTPRYIAHQARTLCELIAHTISLEVESKSKTENYEYISHLKDSVGKIVDELSQFSDIPRCLIYSENNLLAHLDSDGAALILNDKIQLIGKTPSEPQVKKLVEWLWKDQPEDTFSTNRLAKFFAPAEEYQNLASGLLAVRLTRHLPEYLLWFRAEQAQTVTWAGNPEKPVIAGNFGARLTPRKSFEAWEEEVRGQSAAWKSFEIEYAEFLRRSIVDIILHRAEELLKLNRQLEASNNELDSFAYVASHDLKEPLRGINNYSNFLLEDYAAQLDEEAVERLKTLVRLTERMENLLDSLLHYSRVGRLDLQKQQVDLQEILDETLLFLKSRIEEGNVRLIVPRRLPKINGDAVRIGEIFSNLISNSIKYNDKAEKIIEIGFTENVIENIAGEPKTEQLFYVKDNGIGIEEEHYDSVFRIFKRLHGRNEYGGGVGAGLTIVKKIVERHGGKIYLESKVKEGTTFYFTLP